MLKNKEYISKRELNWFDIDNTKISDIDGLYNYIKNAVNDKMIIENNKELKNSNRIALYKAEYYKNGNPKYTIKNRIVCMEYNDSLTWFKIESQFYRHFAHAGKSLIEKIKRIIENEEYLKTNKGKYVLLRRYLVMDILRGRLLQNITNWI